MRFLKVFNVICVLALVSCSSGPRTRELAAGVDLQDRVTELRDRLEEGRARQYDWISPGHFARADEALNRAQSNASQEDAADAAKEIQIVEENAGKYSGQLFRVLKARQAALDAQAHNLVAEEFDGADQRLHGFGAKIEEDEFKVDPRELLLLTNKYSGLEARALKLQPVETEEIEEETEEMDAELEGEKVP